MGMECVYHCRECGEEFVSREGGGFEFNEYRCVDCDHMKSVSLINRDDPEAKLVMPSKEKIGRCYKCGGELRADIGPMCPNCKSRNMEDVKNEDIHILYD